MDIKPFEKRIHLAIATMHGEELEGNLIDFVAKEGFENITEAQYAGWKRQP